MLLPMAWVRYIAKKNYNNPSNTVLVLLGNTISFTISDPVYFEVNRVFKATELTNINNVVRENAENCKQEIIS